MVYATDTIWRDIGFCAWQYHAVQIQAEGLKQRDHKQQGVLYLPGWRDRNSCRMLRDRNSCRMWSEWNCFFYEFVTYCWPYNRAYKIILFSSFELVMLKDRIYAYEGITFSLLMRDQHSPCSLGISIRIELKRSTSTT